MAGIRQLRQIQLAKEATAGSATTATTRWRGLGAFDDNRIVTFPEEFIGIIGGGDRSYIAKTEAALSMDETDATFEQLPHLLIASIANTTAGTQQGTSSGYVYTYTIPTTTAPTINTYSIRAGDNQQAEIMSYSFVQSLSIKGNAGEPVMMSAEWVGREITTSTFSAGVAVPEVETILSAKNAIYMDAVSSTYGATPLGDEVLIAFELNLENLIMPKWVMRPVGDSATAFLFHYAGNREITGSLTLEHNTTAGTQITAFRAQTPQLMRLYFYGSALTTTASPYTTKALTIDLPIKFEDLEPLDDVDGNSIVKLNFRSRYNATSGDAGKFIIVLNGTTSIP